MISRSNDFQEHWISRSNDLLRTFGSMVSSLFSCGTIEKVYKQTDSILVKPFLDACKGGSRPGSGDEVGQWDFSFGHTETQLFCAFAAGSDYSGVAEAARAVSTRVLWPVGCCLNKLLGDRVGAMTHHRFRLFLACPNAS